MEQPPRHQDSKQIVDPQAAQAFVQEGRSHGKNNDQQISLKISAELLAQCAAAAQNASITRSAYIKIAIKEKLARESQR